MAAAGLRGCALGTPHHTTHSLSLSPLHSHSLTHTLSLTCHSELGCKGIAEVAPVEGQAQPRHFLEILGELLLIRVCRRPGNITKARPSIALAHPMAQGGKAHRKSQQQKHQQPSHRKSMQVPEETKTTCNLTPSRLPWTRLPSAPTALLDGISFLYVATSCGVNARHGPHQEAEK